MRKFIRGFSAALFVMSAMLNYRQMKPDLHTGWYLLAYFGAILCIMGALYNIKEFLEED